MKQKSKSAEKPKTEKSKTKQWYSVTMEGFAPVRVTFRVFANSEEDAFEAVEKKHRMLPTDGRPHVELRLLKKKKVIIKNLLNGLINWVRNF
jgi:hypothetical protein